MKNILLIGIGRFGKHIALQLNKLGHEVMAVDSNEERINSVLPFVTNAQIGDSTNADFLKSLGIGNYDVCIVTIGGDFQNSLETTSLLKELGAKVTSSISGKTDAFIVGEDVGPAKLKDAQSQKSKRPDTFLIFTQEGVAKELGID